MREDEFLILAGTAYNEYLLKHINKYELPLKGKKLGQWIPALKDLLKKDSGILPDNHCFLIHQIFNKMSRLNWTDINDIPFNNGIYIMFEKGEKYFTMDCIVRIGTHVADNRLKDRLKNHFIRKNKNGSILRKNIGRSLLHNMNDPYETVWELNTSKTQVREANADSINLEYEEKIENKVSDYLKENISFVCFQVGEKSERLRLEEGLIATLNQDDRFISSDNWLGLNNPKEEIAGSGLWNVQELRGKPLNPNDINYLKELVNMYESLENHTESKETNLKVSTAQIKDFIKQILDRSKEDKLEYIDIVSGDIHKKMGLINKMPSVCNAMYQLKTENDDILHKTESGKSSTIKIRYYLQNKE